MRATRAIRRLVPLVVAAVAVVLLCRTFIVLGVATPLLVEGSSMAPTLLGAHARIVCPNCKQATNFGRDQLPTRDLFDCPLCQDKLLSLDDANWQPGDRLLLDRRVTGHCQPRRWEVVVLRRPDDARTLCVKRVLGLPGESIQFAQGDLLVNGQVVRKSLSEQQQVRVLVHEQSQWNSRWHASSKRWKILGDSLQLLKGNRTAGALLMYRSPDGRSVTDELAGNGSVSRRLNAAGDLMIASRIELPADSTVVFRIERGRQQVSAFFDASASQVQLVLNSPDGQRILRGVLPQARSTNPLNFQATFSLFDRQAMVAVGGEVVVQTPLELPTIGAHSDRQRMAIAGFGGPIRLSQLRVWRDVHYEQRPRDIHLTPPARYQLAADEWFVVGDNQAISHDSRDWSPQPGVPSRLLVGRLLAP